MILSTKDNAVPHSQWPLLIIVNDYLGECPPTNDSWQSTNDLLSQVRSQPSGSLRGRYQSTHRVQVFCNLEEHVFSPDLIFSCPNIFLNKYFPEQIFSWTNIFLNKYFPDQIFSWTNIFLTKYFPDQIFDCPFLQFLLRHCNLHISILGRKMLLRRWL